MGFTTWSRFECHAQDPFKNWPKLETINGINAPLNDDGSRDQYSFQHFTLDQARAMKDSGLLDAGYNYLNADDCWMNTARDKNGALQGAESWNYAASGPNSHKGFDADLTNYVSYVHALGLKAGLYSSSGLRTCQYFPASATRETQDATAFAKWGIDLLKYDNCDYESKDKPKDYGYWPEKERPATVIRSSKKQLFETMAAALATATKDSKRKILFLESAPAANSSDSSDKYTKMEWVRPLGQAWRVGGDIKNYKYDAVSKKLSNPWSSRAGEDDNDKGVYSSFYIAAALSRYVAPGSWNDPDQLLIGDNGMNTDEEKSQFALWSIMGAPLLLSTDIRRLTDYYQQKGRDDSGVTLVHLQDSLKILTNKDIIAVDQDELGIGGYIAYQTNPAADKGMDVVVKPLSHDQLAVVILNKSNTELQPQKINLQYIGLFLSGSSCTVSAKDLWDNKPEGPLPNNELWTAPIPAHGNAMLRLEAKCDGKAVKVIPTGQIYSVAGGGKPGLCLTASSIDITTAKFTVSACNGSDQQIWSRDIATHRVKLAAHPNLCLFMAADENLGLAECKLSEEDNIYYHTDIQDFSYYLNGSIANEVLEPSRAPVHNPDTTKRCLDIHGGGKEFANNTAVATYGCAGSENRVNQIWSAPGAPG
ncbi:alpha-galactosidase [Phyllobacterium myrsinacearum]|nr:alpha-galactosidase [Phyllobacterium myrsinacearum]RZV05925.1 alpha-galactosidase [Phyllobacterium myrsinacearum]